ncbi:hypothetical protein MYCTH_2306586 [Thermothelomyces thermophilus ATCC 42464]|uniref:CST complex subunit STN1 n=1 Tax=Thermothelomyces thermophilus (strain ATCC 42464 / BCRC 31852 / DSM 1799) TaxID=573729 RepID=G2QHM0_THET4|nr:uncharacterized protein MYCTH_2306586 [Thermothelomyces thermophilus ATCC 42464]AEO58880.1 hypothetical protein MYCTH_2306586 [Thermothelomyces thermophilus ATCC 42464]
MTDATKPKPYPQYCFHLSPTINRWCHFRISDIVALKSHPGFRGQDVYFYINHPVKWVRISGMVVAVDERETRHFYVIDDGSGATLECVVSVAPRTNAPAATATATTNSSSGIAGSIPIVDAPIDVGHVLDIKGSVGIFRGSWQIRAEKIVHLRSTEQEVAFWEKVAQLKTDVLSKPWVLDEKEVRRCRKEEEEEEQGRHSGRRHRSAGERRGSKRGGKTGLEKVKSGLEKAKAPHTEEARALYEDAEGKNGRETKTLARRPIRVTGLEKRKSAKPVTRVIPMTGKYDALGL